LDVDARYPALSSLAESQGRTLNTIAKGAHLSDLRYLRLADCCNLALSDSPRWGIDAYNYLATIDEWVRRFESDALACKKVWQKLVGGSPSVFLDTVVELAWGLYFLDQGLPVSLEHQFDPLDPTSKDADVVVTWGGTKYWLDILNIGPNKPDPPLETQGAPLIWRPTAGRDEVAVSLSNRAKLKYDDKFKSAVRSGSLVGSSVGVLLCVLKVEKSVIPQFFSALVHRLETPPPPGLFDEQHPGLSVVWVHTLRARDKSDLLQPSSIVKWSRGPDVF